MVNKVRINYFVSFLLGNIKLSMVSLTVDGQEERVKACVLEGHTRLVNWLQLMVTVDGCRPYQDKCKKVNGKSMVKMGQTRPATILERQKQTFTFGLRSPTVQVLAIRQ